MAGACNQPSNLAESDGTRIPQGSAPITSTDIPYESVDSADAVSQASEKEPTENGTAVDPVIVGGAFLNCKPSPKDSAYQCALTNADGEKIPLSSYLLAWKHYYDGGKERAVDGLKIDGEESFEIDLLGVNQGMIRVTITRDGLKISYDYLIPRPNDDESENPADSEKQTSTGIDPFNPSLNDTVIGNNALALGDGAFEPTDFDNCSDPALRNGNPFTSVSEIVIRFSLSQAAEDVRIQMKDICALGADTTVAILEGPNGFKRESQVLKEKADLLLFQKANLAAGNYSLRLRQGASADGLPDDFRFASIVISNVPRAVIKAEKASAN